MKNLCVSPLQPKPSTPGITKKMVRNHAMRIFHDWWTQRPLTRREWLQAEQDLVRLLEAEAL